MRWISLEVLATTIRKQVNLFKIDSNIVSDEEEIHPPLTVRRDLAWCLVGALEHEMEHSGTRLVLILDCSLFRSRLSLRFHIRRVETRKKLATTTSFHHLLFRASLLLLDHRLLDSTLFHRRLLWCNDGVRQIERNQKRLIGANNNNEIVKFVLHASLRCCEVDCHDHLIRIAFQVLVSLAIIALPLLAKGKIGLQLVDSLLPVFSTRFAILDPFLNISQFHFISVNENVAISNANMLSPPHFVKRVNLQWRNRGREGSTGVFSPHQVSRSSVTATIPTRRIRTVRVIYKPPKSETVRFGTILARKAKLTEELYKRSIVILGGPRDVLVRNA